MTPRAYAVIVSGFLTVSIAYAIRYGFGALLPAMLPALGITKTEAGVISASYFLAYTLFSPVVGFGSDRGNARRILSGFSALLAAGAFGMAFTRSVLSASIVFALAGIGHSACWTPVVALVQQWVPDRRRGTALAFATMGTGFGIGGWTLLLPLIIERHGWQGGWISMGLFGFGVSALNCLLIRNPPCQQAAAQPRPGPVGALAALGLAYRRLLRAPPLWWIGLSYLCIGFTVLVPYTFLSVYATEELGLPYALATRLLAEIAIAGMVGKLLLGTLSDRIGRLPVMALCGGILAVGCLGMALSRHLAVLHLATLVFGLGWGAVWPVYAAAAADSFARSEAGSVIGLWTVFLGAGSIASPVLCGWTIDAAGTSHYAFLLGAAGGLLASVLLLPLWKSRR